MTINVQALGDVSLGTSTAKTELSGDRSGNSTDVILPSACRGILWVQPYLYQTTPTTTQTTIATMKVESDDLGVKDYEVFAPPIGGAVATNDTGFTDLQRTAIYPLMQPTNGGEKMQFYGIPQIANTVAPNMGAQFWWTDDPKDLLKLNPSGLPYRARVGGTAGAAGATTSTGTSTGAVSGATIAIGTGNSQGGTRYLRSVFGLVAPTTNSVSKPIAGWFTITAPELQYSQTFAAEPCQGLIGTGQQIAHLTRTDNLNVALSTPTTLQTALQLTAAPSSAGNFANGILYQ